MKPYEAEALRAYELVGARYDRQTGAFKDRVAYPEIVRMLARLLGALKDAQVLDVGCGSGGLLQVLTDHGALCKGIDLSPGFVARGNARGLSLVVASMLALPFPDQSFDASVSFHSLNYLPYDEQVRALAEQCRVVRPDGIVLAACFFTLEDQPEGIIVPMLGETFRLYPRSAASLDALFIEQGFREVQRHTRICAPAVLDELLAEARDSDEIELLTFLRGKPYMLVMSGRK